METKYKTHHILKVVLLSIALAGLPAGNLHANEDSKYLNAVREFADNVLKYGRDTYGPKHTPLFVDGLNIHTHEPVKWIAPNGDRWVLSNLASQQNLFRTLDGLTKITGDPKYRQAAVEAIEYAFANLRSPNGLLYWGVDAAYDAEADKPCGGDTHELKGSYPYYELMWEVNQEATRQLIEAFWSVQILDWSNLDMDRIGPLDRLRAAKGWEHQYKGGPVFFKSRLGWGRAMMSTGSELFYAGSLLAKLSGDKEPLVWSKRLAHRYVETRHPGTSIAASVYNTCEGDSAQYQLGDDFEGHLVRERYIIPWGAGRPCLPEAFAVLSLRIRPWICALLVGDLLGNDGREFAQWALEELTAWGKVAYRKEDNSLVPILTDGTSLEGYVLRKDGYYGAKGTAFMARQVGPLEFWGYSLAYRMTEDQFMLEMARSIAFGNKLGDIGASGTGQPQLQTNTDYDHPYAILGFLELYRKTENKAFLEMAQGIGDNLLAKRFHKSLFVTDKTHIYARFDALEPLALLQLDAMLTGRRELVPKVCLNLPWFRHPYRGREYEYDINVIYTLTESREPAMSLDEAAAMGKLKEIKRQILGGADVNMRDISVQTPLHLACKNGRKEVAELLLAHGAEVDVGDNYGNTPLYYAAARDYREILKFLLAKGADVNARNAVGDTPLHFAARAGHKDIIELLIANGVDVNAKNAAGQTPLRYAAERGRKDIIELLIANGADVNAKDDDGQTSVDVALGRNRNEVVKLLIEKGADVSFHLAAYLGDAAKVMNFIEQGSDVNAKNQRGLTPLHYAARYGHKEIVEVLLAHGANVNIGEKYYNRTAAEFAMGSNHREIVQLLVSKGADISPLHFALYMKDEAKARSLIEGGADVNRRTPYGTTPLDRAVDAGFKDIVELLIAKGANVNAKDNWDWTPLHSSAVYGSKNMVELLIAKGADINARDGVGRTPLWYAKDKGHTEIVELLRKHGAKE